MKNTWWEYVHENMRGESIGKAADKLGISPSAFTRWKNGQYPDIWHAINFARTYGLNVGEALVRAGFIEYDDFEKNLLPLREIPLTDLMEELQRRLAEIEETVGALGIETVHDNDAILRAERIKRGLLG